MKNTVSCICICFVGMTCFGQQLRLVNEYQSKTFKQNSLFEIVIANGEIQKDGSCCDYLELIGTLKSVQTDSLTLQLSSFLAKKAIENTKFEQSLLFNSNTTDYTIQNNEIYFIRRYKSLASKKRKRNLSTLGGLFIITGTVTSFNAFLVHHKTSRNNILLSGGLQIGLGIGLAIANRTTTYRLKGEQAEWMIE